MRTFSFNRDKSIVSLSSVHGRVNIPINVPEYFNQYIDWAIKSAQVSFDGGRLIIRMVAETKTPKIIATVDSEVLGIDTGIYNQAVLSNNIFFNSKCIRAVTARYQYNRSGLQAKGTRSAKQKLKKLVGREKRFMADVNHCISKQIVHQPFNAIALETLGIKREKRLGHSFNKSLGRWSFGQLQSFIDYKAKALGKVVVYIDPRYTSQKCSNCGHIYKGNRKRHDYRCRKCGFRLHADLNAARNISLLGKAELGRLLNQPIVASSVGLFSEHSNTSVTSPPL
jgi:IS605 OrfB family transposase